MGSREDIDRYTADQISLVRATLNHVPFDGWTPAALRAGAEEAGFGKEDVARILPGGVKEAVKLSVKIADADMAVAVDEMDGFHELKIRERIKTVVRIRLEQAAPHREVVRASVAMLSMPYNLPMSMKLTAETVDVMWRLCGDRSHDYNWYTKRGLLAGVYTSTLLYWLEDKSDDFEETWGFLARRIDNVMQIPKVTGRFKKAAEIMPNPFRFGRRMMART